MVSSFSRLKGQRLKGLLLLSVAVWACGREPLAVWQPAVVTPVIAQSTLDGIVSQCVRVAQQASGAREAERLARVRFEAIAPPGDRQLQIQVWDFPDGKRFIQVQLQIAGANGLHQAQKQLLVAPTLSPG